MDFARFDTRSNAEKGFRLELVNPYEPDQSLTNDGKPCVVIVRGANAPTIQQLMREKAKARMREMAKKKAEIETKKKAEADGKEVAADAIDEALAKVAEDYHSDLVESVSPLVIGLENLPFKGQMLTSSAEDITTFLWLAPTTMVIERDENGQAKLDDDGKVIVKPSNLSFARQIDNAAGEDRNFLGNAPKD